jgi:hypothetical protein
MLFLHPLKTRPPAVYHTIANNSSKQTGWWGQFAEVTQPSLEKGCK